MLRVRDYAGRETTLQITARSAGTFFRWPLTPIFLLTPVVLGGLAFHRRRPLAQILYLAGFPAAVAVKYLGWPGDRLPLTYGPALDVLWVVLIVATPFAFAQILTSNFWRMARRSYGVLALVYLSAGVPMPASWIGSWYGPVSLAGHFVDLLQLDCVWAIPALMGYRLKEDAA